MVQTDCNFVLIEHHFPFRLLEPGGSVAEFLWNSLLTSGEFTTNGAEKESRNWSTGDGAEGNRPKLTQSVKKKILHSSKTETHLLKLNATNLSYEPAM